MNEIYSFILQRQILFYFTYYIIVVQFILCSLTLLPNRVIDIIDILRWSKRGLSISQRILHGRSSSFRRTQRRLLCTGPRSADKSSERRARHLRRGVLLLRRSPGPYPSIYSSSREHIRTGMDPREASAEKGRRARERRRMHRHQ